ncbi:unnamed protein product (macronuclear) [Paramecium tetraurelia]|uniref:Phosphodiesterase n=1 Tax=Paramecium tetraurelia TaxID=5888 RepID=A0BFQ8_PARTE|nr:uncharacterized protein GSPATT00028410001 [Paramecium tetraurelia]CAK57375.1 unnamed protein product [Paramecium tetraurelia]|eukprot:XP_001424773.1 hypothetical protein (macronuclear) [Paramecium tetraurelia strain d4-2]
MNQQLGSYVKFFHIIRELEDSFQIDSRQKQILKVNFTIKDKKLMNILSDLNDEDEEEIKFSLLNYLNELPKEKQGVSRQMKRTRSSITDVDLIKGVKLDDSQFHDSVADMEKAFKLINHFYNKKKEGQTINPKINQIFENIRNLFTQNESQSNPSSALLTKCSSSPTMDMNQLIESDLLDSYKSIKFQFANYMKSHLLLMDENVSYTTIFNLLRELTKNLLDCDHFSFFKLNSNSELELYQTKTDIFDQIPLDQFLTDEIASLPQNKVFRFPQASHLCSKLDSMNYLSSYGLQTNNVIFIYHSKQNKQLDSESILKIANDYQLIDELRNMSMFLIHTIQNAKVQFFSPLSIADMILDLGISFLRASKFILIEQMYNILSQMFKMDKQSQFNDRLQTDQQDIQVWDSESVYIIFKDSQVTVCFRIYSMNLQKQTDQRIYSEVKHYYEKYLRFIRECFDKSAFYKFFLRSNNSLVFEFDKSGHLLFLSRPIPKQIKSNFNIQFNSHMIHYNQLSYNKIFDQRVVSNIENYLQDHNWKTMKDNEKQYEIFLKIEEKTYKGFALIFTENTKGWVKKQFKQLESGNKLDSKIKAKIRKQLIQHETINFVNKLEETNPDVKYSVASLYMPLQQLILKRTKSNQGNQQDQPKIQKSEVELKRSKFATMEELDLNEFCLTSQDDLIDTFDFNIMELTSQKDKHRVVWAILKKNRIFDDFGLPQENLQNFIKEMEYHYNVNNNPYHNYDHGVTVMQTAHYFCKELDQTSKNTIIDNFNRFILMISSFGHDVGHTGRTNVFEINSLSDLAIRYHDKSVLEQHHAALTIQILKYPQCNILTNLNQTKGLISNILSTDMSEHFTLLKDFENRPKNFNDPKILSGYIMHVSDFGGAGKRSNISVKWSSRVNQEFSFQYKLEGELGYPQQPYMKDLHIVIFQSEVGFLKVIVRPCYVLLSEFLEGRLKHCIGYIDDTIQYWEKIGKKNEEQQQQQ